MRIPVYTDDTPSEDEPDAYTGLYEDGTKLGDNPDRDDGLTPEDEDWLASRSEPPLATRDAASWAKWDAAHPYIPHPRQRHDWLDTDSPKTSEEWAHRLVQGSIDKVNHAREMVKKDPDWEGPHYSDAWRELHGYKPTDAATARLLKAASGDKRARNFIEKKQIERARLKGVDKVRPEVRAAMEEGMDRFASDPRMTEIAHHLGIKVRITTAVDTRQEPGRQLDDPFPPKASASPFHVGDDPYDIHLHDTGVAGGLDLEENDELLRSDYGLHDHPGRGAVVASGWQGTMTHEFGHTVEAALVSKNDPRPAEWRKMWQEYHDAFGKAMAEHPDLGSEERTTAQRNRVSYYSHENEKEGFAETFAAVMSPGFDIHEWPPAAQPMLSWMQNLVTTL